MGQLKALLYKNLKLTVRQKGALCCQFLTPVLCLVIIIAIKLLTDSFITEDSNDRVYPALASSPINFYQYGTKPVKPWVDTHPKYFGNRGFKFSCAQLFDFGFLGNATKETRDTFESLTDRRALGPLTHLCSNKSKSNDSFWPQYRPQNFSTQDEQNEYLEKGVKYLNNVSITEIAWDETVADILLLVKQFDTKGMSVNLQTNNILFPFYHRDNFVTSLPEYMSFPNQTTIAKRYAGALRVTSQTEATANMISLLSNQYMNKRKSPGLGKLHTLQIVSPMLDSASFAALINSILSIIEINLFPIAVSMGFPIILFNLVMEKEEKIKSLLEINGLKNSIYWIVYVIYYLTILQVGIFVFLLFGKLFVDQIFWTDTSFFMLFVFLTGWNLAQIGFALFISTFIKNSRTSSLVGYLGSVFIILMIASLSLFLFPYPSKMPWAFYALPQSSMIRGFYQFIRSCTEGECISGPSNLNGETIVTIVTLYGQFVLYFIAGLLFNEPQLYKIFNRRGKREDFKQLVASEQDLMDKREASAQQYVQKLDSLDSDNQEIALLARGITKIYPNNKVALDDFYLSVKKGQIYGLLGPNGAGKTTFLSILTGTLTPETGEAYLGGLDISKISREKIKLGFCPQFDILWPSLTIYEHLKFFSYLKDVQADEIEDKILQVVEQVDLKNDYKKRANQLSGGMKRRCCLAMALIGDPPTIFLDEPSSGLDPVKRRQFWQLIKDLTAEKAVLLTTHLMEEADTLCDEIGIITNGCLRCVGTAQGLKKIYSEGYKIQVVLDKPEGKEEEPEEIEKKRAAFNEQVTDKFGSDKIKVASIFDYTINYTLINEGIKLSDVFAVFQDCKELGVSDWSISQGSLEDVFINIVKKYRGGKGLLEIV